MMQDFWLTSIVIVCIFCALLNFLALPYLLIIALRKRLFDIPNDRTVHTGFVPRLGGITFYPIILFVISLFCGISMLLGLEDELIWINPDLKTVIFAFLSINVIYITGVTDDLIGVRYRKKFLVQLLCGAFLLAGGIYLPDFSGLFGIMHMPLWVSAIVSMLVAVFIINAINLIDGIDGLASGLTSVAFLFYGVLFFHYEYYIYSMICFATLGVLLPFFRQNVFGKAERGRKIFMGDSGSLTIGLIICISSFKLFQVIEHQPDAPYNAFIVAFSPLIVPCFDVIRVFIHRIRKGKDPFIADKNHIHHKFLQLGCGQRRTMVSIVLLAIVISAANIYLSSLFNRFFSSTLSVNLLFFIDLTLWTIAHMIMTKKILSKKSVSDSNKPHLYEH